MWKYRFNFVKMSFLTRNYKENKWIELGFRPLLCTYRPNWVRRTSWGCWDDTALQTQLGFEIQTLEIWGRARYLSVTEAPHNTSEWGRKIFVSFKPPGPGKRTPNSGVKGSGANHYPRAPAQELKGITRHYKYKGRGVKWQWEGVEGRWGGVRGRWVGIWGRYEHFDFWPQWNVTVTNEFPNS